jgi:hypothetical protein
MCRRLQFGLLLLVICGALSAQIPGQPVPNKPGGPITDGSARVIELTGMVSVLRNGDLWALMPNGIVNQGQEIVSGPDGHAILELSDASHVEVFPNSRLLFRGNRTSLRDLLDVILGKVRIHIEHFGSQPNPYKITSPTAFIAVRGTTFEVTVDASDTTTVAVIEGKVDVTHRLKPGKAISLTDGQSITVFANEPLAESHVDRVRTFTKIVDDVGTRVMVIIRQTGGVKTTTPGSVPASTGTGTPTATPGGSTSAGSGTTTPPTNGRAGSGPGSGTGTGTGTGTTTPPITGGTGSGGTGPTSTKPSTGN